GDESEDEIRAELQKVMGKKFQFVWAAVKREGKTKAGIFPSAYHIKVAVRDGEAFWLSSGNWQSSNQPPPDKQLETSATPEQLYQFLQLFNREWHVVIENKELAEIFEQFLQWDLKQASRLQAKEGGPGVHLLPDLLVPIEAL